MSKSFVVMFSGGLGSWGAARQVIEQNGPESTTLLFADTRIEDPDLYRFLDEASFDLGSPLVRIADGRTPWDVFEDARFLGNSRIAPCSTELKQKPARRWMAENAPEATVVLGIDWTEAHRLPGARAGWAPWRVESPLCDPPLISKDDLRAALAERRIRIPRLYEEGFAHNNCGGGCVRAGHAQFANLFRRRPAVFAEWEEGEDRIRRFLNADVAILKDRAGGGVRPYRLRDLRASLEAQPSLFDDAEWGGCGCFLEEVENQPRSTGETDDGEGERGEGPR